MDTWSYLPHGVKMMTTTLTNKRWTPQPYEVWRIPFEFDDHPGFFKQRPVIIGGISANGVDVLLLSVKVTSHPPREGISAEVPLLDWQAAGLPKLSTAHCNKAILLPLSLFRGKKKYGRLSPRDQMTVKAALEKEGFTHLGMSLQIL